MWLLNEYIKSIKTTVFDNSSIQSSLHISGKERNDINSLSGGDMNNIQNESSQNVINFDQNFYCFEQEDSSFDISA